MASPQLQNGHTRIAHDILEAIAKSNMSAMQLKAIIWILRLTYGFQRTEMTTNVNAFATKLKSTGKYIKQIFSELEHFSVITVEWASADLCKIKFNKDFDKWKCFL